MVMRDPPGCVRHNNPNFTSNAHVPRHFGIECLIVTYTPTPTSALNVRILKVFDLPQSTVRALRDS
ncbi:hypothetical protein K474DRAFT_1770201 [Panus rudis PR-1116 ss-1]|nr:hypothetical protein K474DRAFT_1770201 [Panus rudis PR-1116 ss-1]